MSAKTTRHHCRRSILEYEPGPKKIARKSGVRRKTACRNRFRLSAFGFCAREPWLGKNEPFAYRIAGECDAVVDVELPHDAIFVAIDRLR